MSKDARITYLHFGIVLMEGSRPTLLIVPLGPIILSKCGWKPKLTLAHLSLGPIILLICGREPK